jgi:alkanesulfonate monooxygenase SsuD/methylene tetrahydromethanopterin reductase-like flavin-dependent oxidoreductase (luciferase family)
MTDYGQELAFGVFVTPSSQQPQAVVDLAVTADRAGLDLVTFQDHPYQPAFLDTWTLLAYAAARTRRVHLAGNVLNLPLRSPAVLARSVASLDLLSDGRVELGIGAGGFWDAIAAMGGRRLAPGQAVDALAEAIELIRHLWDTAERGVLRFDGTYYRLDGAKRGPVPAHPVGIWIGAYKPKMLRLTGRLGDGWLPSLSYLRPGQLAEGNAIIDDAAAEADRDPAAIRRLLNIGPEQADSPERLAELAVGDGIATFILATDDARAIREYAAETAPAVRELVADARSATQRPATPGSATAGGGTGGGGTVGGTGGGGTVGGTGGGGTGGGGTGGGAATPGVTATPDDGIRRSSTRIWDESTRPSRPAAPPPAGGYPASGRATSADLVGVHNMLRDELSTLRDLIAQVKHGSVDAARARSALNEMTMRQNNWTLGAYCESYCRVVTQHHGLEDVALFPRLRAHDPELGPVLDRLATEHQAIHQLLDEIDQALVRFIKSPDDLSELESVTDLLTDALLSHLSYEERELIDPLARYGYY